MKLLRGLSHFPDFTKGSVGTIGNFDGVHLGHQALLKALKVEADRLKLPLIVLLFEPQPAEFFHALQAPARLTRLREKLAVLKKYDVDYVYCLKFNETLALMPAQAFAETYFFSLLNCKYLLVGEDFQFGQGRLGTIELLRTLGKKYYCQIETFPNFSMNHQRISSTEIRKALARGELDRASELLGRTFSFCGRVVKGDGRGRQWGIPTANLNMKGLTLPLKGVFTVLVRKANGKWLEGVANLGTRPTIDGIKNKLEIHLFNFDEQLYGEMLEVLFLQKLRDEIKFSSVDKLITQIREDIRVAKLKFEQSNKNHVL